MITKEQALEAIDIIEKYQEQEKQKIKELEVDADKRSILILGLDARPFNSLIANDVETIGELLSIDRSDIRRYRNMGKMGVGNINKKLKDFGIETPAFLTW